MSGAHHMVCTCDKLVECFRNNVAMGGVMCSGVRSVRVLKIFHPKLFYFRYLNPLTPKHLNTSFLNATLFAERCTSNISNSSVIAVRWKLARAACYRFF